MAQVTSEGSLDLLMDTTFLEDYEYPLGWVEEAHVINFQTQSVAYLKVGQAHHLLENNQLKLRQGDSQEATLNVPTVTDDGYFRLELLPGRQYELLTRTISVHIFKNQFHPRALRGYRQNCCLITCELLF